MRAIHFNPWRRTVVEVDLDDDGDGGIDYEALRAAVFYGRPLRQRGDLRRTELPGGLVGYSDDDGWTIPFDEQRYLALHSGDPHHGVTLAGHVVVTGDNWGAAALPWSVRPSSFCVQWLDARESIPA